MSDLPPAVGPSCRFDHLPLVGMGCEVQFAAPVNYSFGMLVSLAEALSSSLTTVARYRGGEATGFSISVNDEPGADFVNDTGSEGLRLIPSHIAFLWQSGLGPYQGFGHTVSILKRALDRLPSLSFYSVSLAYTILEPKALPSEMLTIEGLDPAVLQMASDINLGRRMEEGWDHRVQVQVLDEGFLLAVTGGTFVQADASPLDELVRVHAHVQKTFEHLMTGEARNTWGFKGVS